MGEKENNAEKDRQVKSAERLTAKNSLLYQEDETARLQVKDELETLKFSVERCATDLEKTKATNKQLAKNTKDSKKK